jgi:hypothetical protein
VEGAAGSAALGVWAVTVVDVAAVKDLVWGSTGSAAEGDGMVLSVVADALAASSALWAAPWLAYDPFCWWSEVKLTGARRRPTKSILQIKYDVVDVWCLFAQHIFAICRSRPCSTSACSATNWSGCENTKSYSSATSF